MVWKFHGIFQALKRQEKNKGNEWNIVKYYTLNHQIRDFFFQFLVFLIN